MSATTQRLPLLLTLLLASVAGGEASARPPVGALQARVQLKRRETAFARLIRNVRPVGSVVAAPSGNREYQFHWTRDAAITMTEVLVHMKELPPGADRDHYATMYKRYVQFSHTMLREQAEAGAGEPKHFLDGKAYRPWWGRPQNDGPALRATSAISFAEWAMKHEGPGFVHAELYDPGVQHETNQLIKSDLAYVYAHRNEPSYDPWEEQLGFHFYTRAVQAHALARGASFLEKMGDVATANKYRDASKELRGYLDTHWDARYGVMRTTVDPRKGAAYKWTGLDSAVILAANHVQGPDSPIQVLDERLLSTAHLLEVDFKNKYAINKQLKLGLLIGRYPEDRYTGNAGEDRDEGGNPWVITTHGFAEYYFHVAAAVRKAPSLVVTKYNRAFLLSALAANDESRQLPIGTKLVAGDPRLAMLANAIAKKGDAFLKAVRDQVGDGVQTEQLHRTDGKRMGAEDLTWNYASYLSAMRARDRAGIAR